MVMQQQRIATGNVQLPTRALASADVSSARSGQKQQEKRLMGTRATMTSALSHRRAGQARSSRYGMHDSHVRKRMRRGTRRKNHPRVARKLDWSRLSFRVFCTKQRTHSYTHTHAQGLGQAGSTAAQPRRKRHQRYVTLSGLLWLRARLDQDAGKERSVLDESTALGWGLSADRKAPSTNLSFAGLRIKGGLVSGVGEEHEERFGGDWHARRGLGNSGLLERRA